MDYEEENLNITCIFQNIEYILRNIQEESFEELLQALAQLERILLSNANIPSGFIKSFVQLVPQLLNRYKNNKQLVLAFYEVSCLFKINETYLTKHQDIIYSTLEGIIEDKQCVYYQTRILKILNECMAVQNIFSSPRFESILKLLLKNASHSLTYVFCFNSLTKIKKEFKTHEDLILLYECFKGFVDNRDHINASLCLKVSNVVKPMDAYYKSFLAYLDLLVDSENLSGYWNALLANPFKSHLKELSTPQLVFMLTCGLQSNKLHVVGLLDIMKIIKIYNVTDSFTMFELIDRCKYIHNTEVIASLWDILDSISLNKVSYSAAVEECLWILGAFFLKKCPVKKIIDIWLDDVKLNAVYFKKISKEERFDFYSHLLDAVLDKMTKNKVTKVNEVITSIHARHAVWGVELNPEHSFFLVCKIADCVMLHDINDAIELISTSHLLNVEKHSAQTKIQLTQNIHTDTKQGTTSVLQQNSDSFREKITPFLPNINAVLKKIIDKALTKHVSVHLDFMLFICTLAANFGVPGKFLVRAAKFLSEVDRYDAEDNKDKPLISKENITKSHELSINTILQVIKEPMSSAEISTYKTYNLAYTLAVLLIKGDRFQKKLEEIVLNPNLKAIISDIERSELLMHLGLLYFTAEIKTNDLVTHYERSFQFYITYADALKVVPNNAKPVIKEIIFAILNNTLLYDASISNIDQVLQHIKMDFKECHQDVLWIKTFSKYADTILRENLALVDSQDIKVRNRVLKTIAIHRDMIIEIINSFLHFFITRITSAYVLFNFFINS